MNRYKIGLNRLYVSIFAPFTFKKTNIHDTLEEPERKVPETGLERAAGIFREIRPGEPSEELISIIQLGSCSFVMGLLVGGMKSNQICYENFILAHRHVKFVSPYEAKRKLSDTLILNFITRGLKWGLKCAIFTVVFSSCVAAISAYRNKEGIIEYSIGGALAGALARSYLGFKATFAGALIGSAFTTTMGSIIFLSSKLSNTSFSDIRKMQYGWFLHRKEAIHEVEKKILRAKLEDTNHSLIRDHDMKLENVDTSGLHNTEKVFILLPSPNENVEFSKLNKDEPSEGTTIETSRSNS